MEIRVVPHAEVPIVALTMAGAFYHDPVWSWAFPDPEQRLHQQFVWWALNLGHAARHDWIWTIGGGAAATMWIPPYTPEMTPSEAAEFASYLHELVGPRFHTFMEGLSRYAAARPPGRHYYYLGLWATHPAHRGSGLGTRLLLDNLARIDAQRMPCYLESSNPVNLERYGRLGFQRRGEFTMPAGGPVVTTMWRPAR